MRNRLVLLPGWGLGSAPLEPLEAALQGLDERLRVQIEPLPAPGSADLDEWLGELDSALPEDVWLGGWSLGGMLAAELAARRGERCCGLLTMASNACFVARDDWPQAMPANTFAEFQAACAANPAVCLKRFSVLCAQGSEDARGMARLLASAAPLAVPEALLRGLELTTVECHGMPEELRRMIASARVVWPPDLAPWRDAILAAGLRLTAAPIRRRDRARVARLVAGAPSADAVLTGVAGLGAVGLTAMGAQ